MIDTNSIGPRCELEVSPLKTYFNHVGCFFDFIRLIAVRFWKLYLGVKQISLFSFLAFLATNGHKTNKWVNLIVFSSILLWNATPLPSQSWFKYGKKSTDVFNSVRLFQRSVLQIAYEMLLHKSQISNFFR